MKKRKKPVEYDIYTQSGTFIQTELASGGWPWASKRFAYTVGVTLLLFILFNFVVGYLLESFLGFESIFLWIATKVVAGGATYAVFMSVLKAGTGGVLHRGDVGGAETVTFFDQTLIPDRFGGGFSLVAYGPDLAFKYPGTRREGELDLSVKYKIVAIEGGTGLTKSFSVSCGKNRKAEDEVLIDAICPLRRTIRYAYVTFIATRGFDDVETYITETIRGMMNNALDKASKFWSKYDLFADKFGEFSELASLYFINEFKELQKTDPIFRGLAFMNKNGVKFSNARDSEDVQKGRNDKVVGIMKGETTNEIALAKIILAKSRDEELTFKEATRLALIDLEKIKKTEDKKTLNIDPDTLKTLSGIVSLFKGGGNS